MVTMKQLMALWCSRSPSRRRTPRAARSNQYPAESYRTIRELLSVPPGREWGVDERR
jgi:hypothetical protein